MRRAFAMPLVILLALVAGLMGAVLLQRQATVSRLSTREVNGYRDRHLERGLREVIGAWTDSLAGQPVEKMTAPDGHILDLELSEGGGAAVYLFDGQGSFLTDPRGLASRDRRDWEGVVAELQRKGVTGDGSWWRQVGPVAVSAQTAPAPILEAIATYAAGGSRSAKRFASELDRARQQGTVEQTDLNTAMDAADFTPAQRETVTRLVAVRGELKAVIVDVYEPAGRAGHGSVLARRYGGRMVLPGVGKAMTTMQSLGRFLSWEELPLAE